MHCRARHNTCLGCCTTMSHWLQLRLLHWILISLCICWSTVCSAIANSVDCGTILEKYILVISKIPIAAHLNSLITISNDLVIICHHFWWISSACRLGNLAQIYLSHDLRLYPILFPILGCVHHHLHIPIIYHTSTPLIDCRQPIVRQCYRQCLDQSRYRMTSDLLLLNLAVFRDLSLIPPCLLNSSGSRDAVSRHQVTLKYSL